MYKHFQPKLHVCPLVCKSLKLEKKKRSIKDVSIDLEKYFEQRVCDVWGCIHIVSSGEKQR